MIRAFALLLMLGAPAYAQGDMSGTWTGTITTVGTRLQSTYSPITGVSVTPVPDVQITPSPFGPLILLDDGTYAMDDIGVYGTWELEADTLIFTGGLEGVPSNVEWLEGGPVVTLAFPLNDGTLQTITFSR